MGTLPSIALDGVIRAEAARSPHLINRDSLEAVFDRVAKIHIRRMAMFSNPSIASVDSNFAALVIHVNLKVGLASIGESINTTRIVACDRKVRPAATTGVVDQNRGLTCEYIVGVDAGNGDVVDRRLMGELRGSHDHTICATGVKQMVAGFKVGSVRPSTLVLDPERVVGSSGNDVSPQTTYNDRARFGVE